MATYSDFQAQVSSEKLGLCKIEASKRVMGWELESGSIYKVTFEELGLLSVKESDTSYTEVGDIGSIVSGSFFFDEATTTLYVQTSDSSNPNGKFVVALVEFYFANASVHAPKDLSTGNDVRWEPILESTGLFGLSVDNDIKQLGIAVESSGSVTLINDKAFWQTRFDKWNFSNKQIRIYSWNRDIPITEAKLIFKGKIQSKSYDKDKIKFTAKDFLNELRQDVSLSTIESLQDTNKVFDGETYLLQFPATTAQTFQRQILGRPKDIKPVNIHKADTQTGFELHTYGSDTVGTISGSGTSITGSGTSFLRYFAQGDTVYIPSTGEERVIESISSDTAMTVTQSFSVAFSAESGYRIKPAGFNRHLNRIWRVAGHPIRAFETTATTTVTSNIIEFTDATGIKAGDKFQKSGTAAFTVVKVFTGTNFVEFDQVLNSSGTFYQIPFFDVKINGVSYPQIDSVSTWTWDIGADYTDLVFDLNFERNVTKKFRGAGTVSASFGSRTVTGSGTSFTSQIKPGDYIDLVAEYQRVVSIESDTSLTVEVTQNTISGKSLLITAPSINLDFDEVTVSPTSCVDGTTSDDVELLNGPELAEKLLTDAGLATSLDTQSFSDSADLAPERLGMVVPKNLSTKVAPAYRDVLSDISRSVLGIMFQDVDSQIKMDIIRPNRPETLLKFIDSDIISFSSSIDLKDVSKSVITQYDRSEYDHIVFGENFSTKTVTSDYGQHLSLSSKTYNITSFMVDETEVERFTRRVLFILEAGRFLMDIRSKLQAARMDINEAAIFDSSLMYEVEASSGKQALGHVVTARKDVVSSSVEIESLGKFLTRCGAWSASPNYATSTETEKLLSGYWTDEYGLIDNDGDTYNISTWWIYVILLNPILWKYIYETLQAAYFL